MTHDDVEGLPAMRTRAPYDRGRLAVYASLSASLGALPLPWLPDALLRQVRGALVHDLAVRHGTSLTGEARTVLAEPAGSDGPRGLAAEVVRYLGLRLALRLLARFGPFALIWSLRHGLRTYLLGHLFDRYLSVVRVERAVRIDASEARRVRQAVEGALGRAFQVVASDRDEPAAIDDQRDATTTIIDALVGVVAGLPDRVMRRLEAAFDELVTRTPDAPDPSLRSGRGRDDA